MTRLRFPPTTRDRFATAEALPIAASEWAVSLCRAVVGLHFLVYAQTADASTHAILIHLDAENQVLVRSVQGDRIDLGNANLGLIVWADGERDRWQFFSGLWERPTESVASGFGVDFAMHSRSPATHSVVTLDVLQSTTLLPQLRAPPVTRGAGSIVTPYEGSLHLNPCITFRREPANDGETLSAVEATLRQAEEELLKIRFREEATKVLWAEIEDLTEDLARGLPPGSYELELPTPTGFERTSFAVAEPFHRERVLSEVDKLATLLPDQNPLAVHVAVGEMRAHQPALLEDALDQRKLTQLGIRLRIRKRRGSDASYR